MLAPDEMLGPYKLIARIGAGGMGEVWKAEDTRLGRPVAVKILPQQIAADAEAIARMRREARTAAQLYHPNIATIHSFEEADGRTFIVMELVEGEPLTAMIARGPLAEGDVLRIGRGVADALAEAHEHGIVHRDIKPDNIIVRGQRVKVLDFGIAKRVGVESAASNDPTTFMTQQGMILGTVHYMSPEQALGKSVDTRTDIFSLGVVLYQMATGKLPFEGETITDTITKIIRDEPRPARVERPAITPGLGSLIDRCLRKNRDERIGSAAELSKELERLAAVATTEPMTAKMTAKMPAQMPVAAAPTVIDRAPVVPKKRAVWPAIAIVFVLLIGGAALFALHPWKSDDAPVQSQAKAAPVAVPSTSSMSVVETAPATVSEVAPTATTTAPRNLETPKPVDTATQAPSTDPPPTATQEPGNPATTDPHEHLRRGRFALFRHNLGAAEQQFNRALEQQDQLDEHERLVATLGLAIAHDDRQEALRIAKELHRANPNDRDLMALRREYGDFFWRPNEQQREREVPRRRRW